MPYSPMSSGVPIGHPHRYDGVPRPSEGVGHDHDPDRPGSADPPGGPAGGGGHRRAADGPDPLPAVRGAGAAGPPARAVRRLP
ncbi:hypothetical protein SGPA1_31493 [Streptomyces misionensis JCM 4497]